MSKSIRRDGTASCSTPSHTRINSLEGRLGGRCTHAHAMPCMSLDLTPMSFVCHCKKHHDTAQSSLEHLDEPRVSKRAPWHPAIVGSSVPASLGTSVSGLRPNASTRSIGREAFGNERGVAGTHRFSSKSDIILPHRVVEFLGTCLGNPP